MTFKYNYHEVLPRLYALTPDSHPAAQSNEQYYSIVNICRLYHFNILKSFFDVIDLNFDRITFISLPFF